MLYADYPFTEAMFLTTRFLCVLIRLGFWNSSIKCSAKSVFPLFLDSEADFISMFLNAL